MSIGCSESESSESSVLIRQKENIMLSCLTEIVSEIEGLVGGPNGVISGGSVGGGIEEPPDGAAHCVVGVTGDWTRSRSV